MNSRLRAQIWQRALNRCEYCLLPQRCTVTPHEVEHIVSLKHGGPTSLENLALACAECNGYKQTDLTGLLPGTTQIIRLFNPRIDEWNDHFQWESSSLVGKTDVGTVTIYVLGINRPHRVVMRAIRMESGDFFAP